MKKRIAVLALLVSLGIGGGLFNEVSTPGSPQQKPKPTPTPEPLQPPLDCIANPCGYSPYVVCPNCCNGVPCKKK